MRVILLKDIDRIGKRRDIKEVASGHARNFLIPKGLAVLATQAEVKKTEELKKAEAQKAEEELQTAQSTADQLDGLEIEIPVKVNEEGSLFGAIDPKQVSDKLKERGFDIQEKEIKLKEPIREIGEYDVDIELLHGLEAKIKVIIAKDVKEEKSNK